MKNKFLTSVLVFSVLVSGSIFSQEKQHRHKERKEEIEAKKIAFITDKISLSTEEAQSFWPIYNEYNEAKENLMKENRRKLKGHDFNYDDFSETELLEMAKEDLDKMLKLYELRKTYHDKFLSVLPVKKVLMLYDAERNFKKVLLDDLREKRKENMKNR